MSCQRLWLLRALFADPPHWLRPPLRLSFPLREFLANL
jgi:hypothetical protein